MIPPGIAISYCSECQHCCHDIPTLICNYHFLHAIEREQLNINVSNDLCIYRFPRSILEDKSRTWTHNISPQIIRSMTIQQKGFYKVLAILKTRGSCPLLGPQGCIYPEIKPLYCAQFPFYHKSENWEVAPWCLYSDKLKLSLYAEQLEKCQRDFLLYSQKYSSNFFSLLEELQQKNNWKVLLFK